MNKKTLIIATFFFLAMQVHAQTVQPPVIARASVNAGSFSIGNPVTMTWNRSGNFPTNDYYFVFLKNKPDQLLGSHTSVASIQYSTVVSWQSTLAYPSFTFSLPFVSPGTYYLEVDFVDARGMLITTATSNSFGVNQATVTTGSLTTPSTQLSPSVVWQVETLLTQLIAKLNLILQQTK